MIFFKIMLLGFYFLMSSSISFSQENISLIQSFESEIYSPFITEVLKDNNGDYFIMVEDFSSDYMVVGNDTIHYDLSEFGVFETDRKNVLMKIDGNDFSLINYVQIRNITLTSSKLRLIDNTPFIATSTSLFSEIFVKDSLYSFESDDLAALFQFSDDLNEVKAKSFKNYLLDISGKYLTSCYLRFGIGSSSIPVFNEFGETLEADSAIENGQTVYASNNVVLVRYNIFDDEVLAIWKFGGMSEVFVSDMQTDSDGDVILTGIANPTNFTFDNNKVYTYDEVNGSDNFYVKFDSSGNVVFGVFSFWNVYNRFGRIYIDESDIYIAGSMSNDTMDWDGQVIYNYKNVEKEEGFVNSYLAKLKLDGTLDWIYDVEAYLNNSDVWSVTVNDGKVTLSMSLADGTVQLGDEVYDISSDYFVSHIYTLDSTTGTLLSYRALDEIMNENIVRYAEMLPSGELEILFSAREAYSIFGTDLGKVGKNNYYLLRVNVNFTSDVKTYIVDEVKVDFYPNPTTGILKVVSDVNFSSVELYSSEGSFISRQSLNSNVSEIDVSNLSNGIYFLKLIDEDKAKVISFIKT